MYVHNNKRYPTITQSGIHGFFEEYRWLSNMYPVQIVWTDGYMYESSETIYQMEKLRGVLCDEELVSIFHHLNGPQAKKEIKKYNHLVRSEWDIVKTGIMYDILYKKFTYSEEMKSNLLATNKLYLEETNNWKDEFWGKVFNSALPFDDPHNRIGYNTLGILLMSIRKRIMNENIFGSLAYE